jgi:putative membrane protein
MNLRSLIFTSFISVFAATPLLAFSYPDNHNNPQAENQSVGDNKDGEVIATLITINKNEIAAANLAEKKQISPMVKNYAKLLHKDHSQNLNNTIKLSHKINERPEQTEGVIALRKHGQEEMATLQPLNGQKFEVAFINDMVKGHQAALDKIDNTLLQNAHNPQLKRHLQMTRNKVAQHLQIAKKIQSQLKSSPE